MDDDRRELLRRLFASATELIETAHEAEAAGQSDRLPPKTTSWQRTGCSRRRGM